MAVPAPRPASYDDIVRAPPHLVAELLDGELSLLPRPRLKHAAVALRLGGWLHVIGGKQGWVFLTEPELHLGDDVVVPDIAAWRLERFPTGDLAWTDVAPDWVCEVLSPSTERLDRTVKRRIYRAAGVPWMWLVNADTQHIEVYEGAGAFWTWHGVVTGDDGEVAVAPFDGVPLPLRDIFGEPSTPPP